MPRLRGFPGPGPWRSPAATTAAQQQRVLVEEEQIGGLHRSGGPRPPAGPVPRGPAGARAARDRPPSTAAARRWAAASNPGVAPPCGVRPPRSARGAARRGQSAAPASRTGPPRPGTARAAPDRSRPSRPISPLAARGSSIVLTHRQPAIETHAGVASGESARLQLRGEPGRGVLRALDDEVLDLAPAGHADHGDSAIVQVEADTRGHHDATPGRQETIVRVQPAAAVRPRCTTATTRPRGTPPTRPSASIRNVLLPTVNPRPANRPGTVG